MAEDPNAKYGPRPGQEIPGESFEQAFKRHKAAGRADFPWRGKTYTTETMEERIRKAYSDPSRKQEGAAAAAMNRPGRIRPDETATQSSVGVRDIPGLIARGMSEGADRVPTGRGLGAAFTAAGAARGAAIEGAWARRQAANAAAETERLASRSGPTLDLPTQANVLRRAKPDAEDVKMLEYMRRAEERGLKNGGKVKAYAKGGSVKGAGCEQRGLRKCKVY
jgi:hypothetical protein